MTKSFLQTRDLHKVFKSHASSYETSKQIAGSLNLFMGIENEKKLPALAQKKFATKCQI